MSFSFTFVSASITFIIYNLILNFHNAILKVELDTAQLTSIINHTCNCRKAERPDRSSSLERSVENFIFENISAEISAEIWQKWCRKLSPPKIISAELNLRRNISPVRYTKIWAII